MLFLGPDCKAEYLWFHLGNLFAFQSSMQTYGAGSNSPHLCLSLRVSGGPWMWNTVIFPIMPESAVLQSPGVEMQKLDEKCSMEGLDIQPLISHSCITHSSVCFLCGLAFCIYVGQWRNTVWTALTGSLQCCWNWNGRIVFHHNIDKLQPCINRWKYIWISVLPLMCLLSAVLLLFSLFFLVF